MVTAAARHDEIHSTSTTGASDERAQELASPACVSRICRVWKKLLSQPPRKVDGARRLALGRTGRRHVQVDSLSLGPGVTQPGDMLDLEAAVCTS